jgi:cytochrome c-type biogenesis protein CcmH
MPSRLFTSFALALAVSALPAVALADAQHGESAPPASDLQEYVEGAKRLEGRIIAPCCWNQTIDIHGSEPSYALRREIRARLKAGEASDAIEASLIQRYGQKILAVQDKSPIVSVANTLGLAFLGAGIGAYFMLKRWSRAGADAAKKKPSGKGAGSGDAGGSSEPKRDALDERLDRELAEIGDKA